MEEFVDRRQLTSKRAFTELCLLEILKNGKHISISMNNLGKTVLRKECGWRKTTLKGPCNLRIQCSRRSAWKAGNRISCNNSLKWKLDYSNLGIELKQIFRVLAGCAPAPLKWQLKEGGVLFPGWSRISLSLFSSFLAPAGLEWCRPSNQTVDVPRAWPPASAAPPPPRPMTPLLI